MSDKVEFRMVTGIQVVPALAKGPPEEGVEVTGQRYEGEELPVQVWETWTNPPTRWYSSGPFADGTLFVSDMALVHWWVSGLLDGDGLL